MGTILASGSAPSIVGNLTAGSPSSNTIPVTFLTPTGTAPISYAGFTSIHGAGAWSQNSGSFLQSGGTFIGLTPAINYDLRIIATNAYGASATDLLSGISTTPAVATSYTVALSGSNGSAGTAVIITVTPILAGWPSGEVVSPLSSGIAGSFDNASLVGIGAAPLTFTFTPISGPGSSGTLTAVAASMTNSSGPQAYSINAVTTSTTANRFDIVTTTSAVSAGSAVQVTVYPNASFPSGTIVLVGTNGTFASSPSINLTRGSAAPITVTYTPAVVGEHAISASNTSGLYNPYPAPLTVFSSASGAPQSLAASLTRSDMTTYQRDVSSGSPSGFSLAWSRGWGEVWINVTALSGTTSGLWVRLYDAMSVGASSSLGSGTALNQAPVQVYGAVSGTGVVRVLLPAGPYIYYADVATDAAFTNPIRIAQRFRVGVVIGHFSRSQESGLSRSYAYTNNTPLPTNYQKTATWVGFDYRYQDYDSGWYVHDGTSADSYAYHYSEASSSGAQEIGRLIESQLGVCVGIAGNSATGGGLDSMVNHDGSLAGGFTGTVVAAVGSKFRYLWMATGGWDGIDSSYPSETHAEVRTRALGAVDWIAKTFPSCAVIGWVTSASGIFGSDGSRSVGYTRNQMIFMNEIEPSNPMVVSKENYNWNEYNANHATMSARVDYVRPGFRKLMAAELVVMGGFQTAARGPTLAAAGTFRASGRVISIPYALPSGASALQTIGLTYSNPNPVTINGATAQEIAGLFAVYGPGGYQGNGTAIKIDSAVVNTTAKTIDLALSGSSGVIYADGTTGVAPTGFSVQFAADFGASNGALAPGSGRSAVITDDRVDSANGIPYGWHMLPALDIAISTV